MDLAELIKSAKGTRSYDQLAALTGGAPTSARLQQLATQPQKNFPDPESLRGIARALGVSERVVVLAAAETLGLRVSESRSALEALLPARVDQLTPDQVSVVLQTIRALLPEEVAGGDTAAKKPARSNVRKLRATEPDPDPIPMPDFDKVAAKKKPKDTPNYPVRSD